MTNNKIKLYLVEGIRHYAIVVAESASEAIRLAIEESESRGKKRNSHVLYGYVGSWESPESVELALPDGYKIVRK